MKISPLEKSARVIHPPRILILGALPPDDFHPFHHRLVLDPEAEFDAIVIGEGGQAGDAADALERAGKRLAPVGTVSPVAITFADVRARGAGAAAAADVIAAIVEIVRRVDDLPEAVRRSADPSLVLLARCATRDGGLGAAYCATVRECVIYPNAGRIEAPQDIAERLAETGMVRRTFFDRLHVCPSCRSSRLNVREECPACRCAAIAEEATVHHFACAHMALERAFRVGEALVCPKCRKTLRHFGVDYDKPGGATLCRGCGHVDGEPAIGFRCLDCGAHHDAQTVGVRDWHSYALTPAGEAALARGAIEPVGPSPAPGGGRLRHLVRQGLALKTHSGRPMALVAITFANAHALERSHGERFARHTIALAIETIRGSLREIDCVAPSEAGLVIYMPETEPAEAMAMTERLLARARAALAADLGLRAAPLDPSVVLADGGARR